MGPLDLLQHLLNFLAPAACLALLLPVLSRGLLRATAGRARWWVQVTVLFGLGVAVLAGGLWWLGRDGKMLTYAALVAVLASGQWALLRAWR